MDDKSKFYGILILLIFVLSLGYVIIDSGGITGFATRTGQLLIGNSGPTVDYIYINYTECTDTYTDVEIDPTENTTTGIVVKAWISDLNGDCNTFTGDNGTAYLCDGTTTCTAAEADHTITLNYNSSDGQWGQGNRYCNMSGSIENMYFFEANGSWVINVTLTDGVNESTPVDKKWHYTALNAFTYPFPGGNNINLGTLSLDQWNNGTGYNLSQNAGNIPIDLQWNATNFTGQTYADEIDIDGTNFIIDDDASGTDDTGNITMVYINETPTEQMTFCPSSGMLVCADTDCANTNATMPVYWHIFLPGGLMPDNYTNIIEISLQDH